MSTLPSPRPLPAAPSVPDSRTAYPRGRGESGVALADAVLPLVLLVWMAAVTAALPIALDALLGAR